MCVPLYILTIDISVRTDKRNVLDSCHHYRELKCRCVLELSQRVLDGIGPTNRHLVAFHTFTVQVSNTDTLRRIHHISRHHSFDTVIHGKKTGGNCLHCCFLFHFLLVGKDGMELYMYDIVYIGVFLAV